MPTTAASSAWKKKKKKMPKWLTMVTGEGTLIGGGSVSKMASSQTGHIKAFYWETKQWGIGSVNKPLHFIRY